MRPTTMDIASDAEQIANGSNYSNASMIIGILVIIFFIYCVVAHDGSDIFT